MNFFKSVFSDDPDPPTSPEPDPDQPTSPPSHQPNAPDPNPTTPWTFGSIITTLHAKSEWINTYKKDIEEFGSGLKKETQLIRDVVMDLPDTIDATASKAQLSLERIGTTLDSIGTHIWNSTADVISHGKDSTFIDNDDVDVKRLSLGRYNRFDSQLRAIQCDVGTYVSDPDDVDEFLKWKNGFDLGGKSEEIDGLLKGNDVVSEVYDRVVCNGNVEHDAFWLRYFYRVHRLVLAENARAELVKRAISKVDDEDLSWDVDDEDGGDVGSTSNVGNVVQNGVESRNEGVECGDVGSTSNVGNVVQNGVESRNEGVECGDVGSTSNVGNVVQNGVESRNEGVECGDGDKGVKKCEEGKESDVSVVSTQPSQEEDDMGWDEIEDVGSDDENKGCHSGGTNKDELRKRLSAVGVVDDDEDLSWDIEDDD